MSISAKELRDAFGGWPYTTTQVPPIRDYVAPAACLTCGEMAHYRYVFMVGWECPNMHAQRVSA